MKRNRFIYLIIFALVFLGFTNGVEAGCCYEASKDAGGNIIYRYDGTVPNSECGRAFPSSTNPKGVADEATCLAKNKFCCNTTTGENTGKPYGACGSNNKWANVAECAAAYEYNKHQCCDDNGKVLNVSQERECSLSSSNGFKWRTIYECRSLEMVCCINGNTNLTDNLDCSQRANRGENAHWVPRAECEGLSPDSTRDSINHIDMENPYVTPPSTSNPDNSHSGDGSLSGNSGSTGDETITIGFNCNDSDIKSIIKTVKTVYNLLRYSVPIILIIMGSIDFLKATIAGKDDEIEKHKKVFMNRLFLAIVIFMLLSIFQLTTNILEHAGVANSNSWVECWNHIND